MADQKLSALTNEVTAPTPDARFYVVDDVGGTPADGYVERQNMKTALGVIDGVDGVDGTNGTNGTDGADGADGVDGVGVPVGGTTSQVLAKASATDHDTEWVDPPSGGGGGGSIMPTENYGHARTTSFWGHPLPPGPFESFGNASLVTGRYSGAVYEITGGTVASIAVRAAGGGAGGDEFYIVVYDVDADNMPTTLQASFGPFAGDAAANLEITGLSETLTAGKAWVGGFAPESNANTVTVEGAAAAYVVQPQTNEFDRPTMYHDSTDTTPAADLSTIDVTGISTSGWNNLGGAHPTAIITGGS